MDRLRSRALSRYLAGLGGILFAAWLSDVTSMVPLALPALLCTASLVKAFWTKAPIKSQ